MSVEVSIVTPSREPARARGSVLAAVAHEGLSLEVIVVDDTPRDRAAQVTTPDDERVTVLRVDPHVGFSAGCNHGVSVARGDWITLLREGDLWAPDHLAGLIAGCEADGSEFGYSASWAIGSDAQIYGFNPVPRPHELARELMRGPVLRSPSVLLARRTLWKRAGGFDAWLDALATWNLWIRWSRIATGWSARDAPTAAVVLPDAASQRAMLEAELRELRRRYKGDARGAGVRFGEAFDARHSSACATPQGQVPWLHTLFARHHRTSRH